MADFNAINPNIQFTYETSKKSILHVKLTDRTQYLHYSSSHPEDTKISIALTKLKVSVESVLVKTTLEILPPNIDDRDDSL